MRLSPAVVLALALGAPVAAQEMRPLHEVLPTAAAPYGFTRCAGLYQAVMEWAGAERLGEDTFAATELAMQDLATVAVIASQQTSIGGTTEHVLEVVLRDVRNVADLYLARFEANYAAQGEAFAGDQIVSDDLMLCREFAAEAHQFTTDGQ